MTVANALLLGPPDDVLMEVATRAERTIGGPQRSSNPPKTASGSWPTMVVSAMHDITAAAHQELMRDQFFAAAAHSLKTPVAIIKTNVQGLAQRFDAGLTRPMAAIERRGQEARGEIAKQLEVLERRLASIEELLRSQSKSKPEG